jgi:hypothetical protein
MRVYDQAFMRLMAATRRPISKTAAIAIRSPSLARI